MLCTTHGKNGGEVQGAAGREGKSELLPQVVSAAQDKVGFGVQGRAYLSQTAVTACALQAVFMPVFVQGF